MTNFSMEYRFGVVNTIATAVIICITLLNIIFYKLRQIQEANLGDKLSSSSSSSQLPEGKAESSKKATLEQLQNENLEENLSSPSSPLRSARLCRHFPLGEILLATNNFDDTRVIGRGGFGKVYKGVIDNGAVTVAIKRSNPLSRQGAPQFWTEVKLLSRLRHSHLVSLIGYCHNLDEMILVYEYMPRGSLADHLYKTRSNLSWIQRLKICIGAGQGLDYLHTGTGINDRVIHRDMKSSNILLDDSWAAKVSDFGLSKIGPANQELTHVSTNVKGTYGFFDPEYMTTHRLTRKSDVYSFGVVLLEVLSGKRAMDPEVCEVYWDLAAWAKECIRKNELEVFIDPYLKHEILPNSLKEYVQIAEKCLQYRSMKRPTMAEVVASLEHVLALQERTDSSMFKEDFMNLGWTPENEEHLDEVSDHDAGNSGGVTEAEVISDVGLSGNSQSHVRPSKTTLFKKFARIFKGKPRASSVNETSNSESSPEYDFDTIQFATDYFSYNNVIGITASGGVVYKGMLQDGTLIAVKTSSNTSQDESEFRRQASLMGKLQHRNLANLLGYCLKGTERFLVYPFFANSSLDHFIHDPVWYSSFDWERCTKIIKGISRGIIYLHEDSPVRIIHRDLKPSHILLDEEMTPKISGFGISRPLEGGESALSTLPCGTIGYIAPECTQTFRVSVKSDVYSFGVLVLNIISGQGTYIRNSDRTPNQWLQYYAAQNWRNGMFWDVLISPHLSRSGSEVLQEIKRCIHIALLCIEVNKINRPTMSSVLHMLNNPSLSLPEPSVGSTVRYSFREHISTSLSASFVGDMRNDNVSVNEDSSSDISPR